MENNALKSKNRIDWIDLAKGIGMILVVVAHTVCLYYPSDGEELTKGIVYSFHMPLFFILSMLTYKLSENGDMFLNKTRKAFRHLIIPAVVLYALKVIMDIIMHPENISSSGWMDYSADMINSLIYSSPTEVSVGGGRVLFMGIMWFLVALFFSRTIYDYIRLRARDKKTSAFIVCILAFVGVTLGEIQRLPLVMDVVFAILPFLAFGEFLKGVDLNKNKFRRMFICLLIWAATFFVQFNTSMSQLKYTLSQTMHLPENIVSEFIYIYDRGRYLDLGMRSYPLFPICFISAAAGVMVMIYICTLLVKAKKLMLPLIYIGRNSMYFFWVHTMDYLAAPIWSSNDRVSSIIPRLITDIIIFLILMLVMWSLKKLRTFIKGKISLTEN